MNKLFFLRKRTIQTTLTLFTMFLIDSFLPTSIFSSIFSLTSNAVLAQTISRQNSQASQNRSAEQIYQDALPAVVRIETSGMLGTGSIISHNGLIITNAHVVEHTRRGETIQVTLSNNKQVQAIVLGFAPDSIDLAILQIPNAENLPSLAIADSNNLNPGQAVHLIGNALGLSGVINSGQVAGSEPGIILLDLDGNPGNSGGPVLNSRGELIAVYTGRLIGNKSSSGLSFGVASDLIQAVMHVATDSGLSRISTLPSDQQIAINDPPLVNTLTENSRRLNNGNRYDRYIFEGTAGQDVVIEMTSDQVDPSLQVFDPNGEQLKTDAGEGNKARIRLRLPSDGSYFILANTDGAGETGDYRLQITEASFRTPRNRNLILQERGTLRSDSPVLREDDSRYRQHTFQAEAGDRVVISMDSDDFDTYLMLFNANGEMIDSNDDRSSTSSNSELQITLSRSGSYTVYANAYAWVEQGSYTLTILKMN